MKKGKNSAAYSIKIYNAFINEQTLTDRHYLSRISINKNFRVKKYFASLNDACEKNHGETKNILTKN
ncbi:hypothetical protein MAH4_26210 [Sessilibacter sp. MAH4]